MINYIKAEFFRHKKIKSHYLLIAFTLLVPILSGTFLKAIAPYQSEKFWGNDFLYIMFMFLLTGFYLVYPITICANSLKPKFVRRQLLTSSLNKLTMFVSDITYINLINVAYLFLFSIISILSAVGLFKMDSVESSQTPYTLTISEFSVLMVLLGLTMILSNVILYGLQLILENKVLSTGIFVFIIYIIPLILAQLRHFSDVVEKLASLVPFLQILFYYRGESDLLTVVTIHLLAIAVMMTLFLFFYNRNEE